MRSSISRRKLLGGVAASAVLADSPTLAWFPHGGTGGGGPPAFTGATYNGLIGAGGFQRGLSVSNDGTLYCRNDSGTAYRWNGSKWVTLTTNSGVPSDLVTIVNNGNGYGCYDIAVAPSLGTKAYMVIGQAFTFSTDSGTTWTQATTGPTTLVYNQNDNNSHSGPHIAVDPQNTNHAWIATVDQGAWFTTNGGVNWTQISTGTLPVSVAQGGGQGVALIAFDPASSVSGGTQQGLYYGSSGHGWYHSTNAGATWTLTTSGPTAMFCAACSLDGYLYSGDASTASLSIYHSGSWSTSGSTGFAPLGVAPDPGTTGRVAILTNGSGYNISTNHGATFNGYTASPNTLVATDLPWLATTSGTFMDTGYAVFDPSQSNRLISIGGVAIWVTTPTTASGGVTPTWTSQSIGINNLVPYGIISPPGSVPVVGSWDRSFFPVYPVPGPGQSYVPNLGGASLQQGFSVDYAASSPNVIAGVSSEYNAGNINSGYSTDAGQSWTVFPGEAGFPHQVCGCIAVNSSTNFVRSVFGSAPYYTTDAGTTWTASTGGSTFMAQNSQASLGRFLCADRVTAGTFYAIDLGTQQFYKSTNSGATWASVGSTPGGAFGLPGAVILSVPGQAGHVWFCGSNNFGANALHYSTNAGTSWTAVPGVSNMVYPTVALGAVYPGKTYPTVYVVATIGGVFGLYRNIDFFGSGTWQNLTPSLPQDIFYPITVLGADATAFGWVYLGFQTYGYMYGVSNDAAPWGAFTSPTQGSTIAGTVTLTAAIAAEIACTKCQFQIDGVNTGSAVTGSNLTTASISYNAAGLAGGAHTLGAVLTGNGQTTTALCWVAK